MASDDRVVATPAAREALRSLRHDLLHPVVLVQSGGCCEGSTPLCLPAADYPLGSQDVLLATIEGYPFYLDRRLDVALGHPRYVLDVAEGAPEGFSIAAPGGRHFTTRPA